MKLNRLLRLEWDRTAAVVSVLIGVLVLGIGWVGASSTLDPGIQIPYALSGGVGGVFFLGVGATLWLSADLRDEWCKLDAIDETLKRLDHDSMVDGRAIVGVAAPANPTSMATTPSGESR
jgi:hypothetical protein